MGDMSPTAAPPARVGDDGAGPRDLSDLHLRGSEASGVLGESRTSRRPVCPTTVPRSVLLKDQLWCSRTLAMGVGAGRTIATRGHQAPRTAQTSPGTTRHALMESTTLRHLLKRTRKNVCQDALNPRSSVSNAQGEILSHQPTVTIDIPPSGRSYRKDNQFRRTLLTSHISIGL